MICITLPQRCRRIAGLCLFSLLICLVTAAAGSEAFAAPLLLTDNAGNGESKVLRLVLDDLSQQQGMVINVQRELVARPSIGPEYGGTGEEEKARWVAAWLGERGAHVERLDFVDERVPGKIRPNLVAVYPDSALHNKSGRTLWLLGHFDVAAPGPRELWSSDPGVLRVDGDLMYGRGVEDNNQALTVAFLLMDSLKRHSIAPPVRLGFVFTSGALTDYAVGIGHVLEKKPDIFAPDDLIVVMDYGNARGSEIGVGEKGNLWLKITVTGKEGHAGTPQKAVNAFAAAAVLVNSLRTFDAEFPAQNPLFNPPHSTFTPTKSENASTGVNHIPAEFSFYVDARVLADYSFEAVEAAMRRLADTVKQAEGVRIALQRVEATDPSRVTPADAPVLSALDRAVKVQLGVEPRHVGTGGVTMAASIRVRGLPVAVWGIQETLRNTADEHASIKAHLEQAKVLARVLFDPMLMQGAERRGQKPSLPAQR